MTKQAQRGDEDAAEVSLRESRPLSTGGAALIDEDAQGVAGGEPQVGPVVDGGAEHAGDALEGRQQVDGTRAEARQHRPNLGGNARL